MTSRVILSLGSNLGNRRKYLVTALAHLARTSTVELIDVSGVYESKALTLAGVDSSKPKYLNCVAEISTHLKPEELLKVIQAIETKLGRSRKERWGDRTIDIDIIKYGDLTYRSMDLAIPHPETRNRAFVIVPWFGMDENAELPGFGKIAKLAEIYIDQVKLT